MNSVLLIFCGFFGAVILSEIVLKGEKLQTGLVKVVVVHALVAIALLFYFLWTGSRMWGALLVFWSGAFLTWFGVRSHMESSILLRMLYMLRKNPFAESRLLEEYESHYGEQRRLEELFRGALVEKSADRIIVTPKGKLILRVVSLLT